MTGTPARTGTTGPPRSQWAVLRSAPYRRFFTAQVNKIKNFG